MASGSGTEKSAGDGLIEKAGFLKNVIDCIQDGIGILDSDLNVLYTNQAMEKWYSHQMPLVGKKCYEVYHGRQEECEICPSLKTLKSGSPAMEVVPYTGPEGAKGWLELFTFPLMDTTTDKLTGVIEYVRDITERKRAEEAWRESEERFRRLSEASFEGIAIHDGERILAANQTFAEMFGYEFADISGKSLDFIAPEYADLIFRNKVCEAVCMRKDKTRFICQVRGKEIPFHGRTARVCAVRDITERKEAEERLAESEKKYRAFVDNALVGVYKTNLNGDILFANEAFATLFEFESPEEIMSCNVRKIYETPSDREDFLAAIKKAGRITDWEIKGVTKNGRPIDFLLTGTLEGEAISGTVLDITRRKQAEAKLKRSAEDLQRSNRELEEFAAVASHDLQSPLISVLSALSLMERYSKGGLCREAEEYLVTVRDRIENMIEVIRSMLEYSRVDTAHIEFKRTDMEAVLDRSIGNLMADIAESGATVTHDPLPETSGDATLLAQVFQNLIGNAIKFQGKEPPRVHISAEQKDKEWVFSVHDNGIGMAPEDTGHIFEIFHSLKAMGEYHGAGIGLATCKKIVKLHGGRIWAESEPGRGSKFHFTVPDRLEDS